MNSGLESLWLAHRAGELDALGDEHLAAWLQDEPELLARILADLETEALLHAAAVDDAAFVRGFRQRLEAERDGSRFVTSLQRRLPWRVRRRGWLAASFAAAAILILILGLPRTREERADGPAADPPALQTLPPRASSTLVQDEASLVVHGPARYRSTPIFTLLEGRVDCAVTPGGEGFSLRTNQAEISVLGTRFTVGADDRSSSVTVEHGRVRVRRDDGAILELGAGLHTRFGGDGPLLPRLTRPGVVALISSDPQRDPGCRALGRVLEADGWRVHRLSHGAPQLPADCELVIPLQAANSGRLETASGSWQRLPVLCLDPSINRWLGLSAQRDNAYLAEAGTRLELDRDRRPFTAGLAGPLSIQSAGPLHWAEPLPGVETVATWPEHPQRSIILLRSRHGPIPPRLFVGINPAAEPTVAGWALLRAAAAWLVAEGRAPQQE